MTDSEMTAKRCFDTNGVSPALPGLKAAQRSLGSAKQGAHMWAPASLCKRSHGHLSPYIYIFIANKLVNLSDC